MLRFAKVAAYTIGLLVAFFVLLFAIMTAFGSFVVLSLWTPFDELWARVLIAILMVTIGWFAIPVSIYWEDNQ